MALLNLNSSLLRGDDRQSLPMSKYFLLPSYDPEIHLFPENVTASTRHGWPVRRATMLTLLTSLSGEDPLYRKISPRQTLQLIGWDPSAAALEERGPNLWSPTVGKWKEAKSTSKSSDSPWPHCLHCRAGPTEMGLVQIVWITHNVQGIINRPDDI